MCCELNFTKRMPFTLYLKMFFGQKILFGENFWTPKSKFGTILRSNSEQMYTYSPCFFPGRGISALKHRKSHQAKTKLKELNIACHVHWDLISNQSIFADWLSMNRMSIPHSKIAQLKSLLSHSRIYGSSSQQQLIGSQCFLLYWRYHTPEM